MIWLAWRQQRLETILIAAVLVLVTAVLVPVGLHMASVYGHDGAAACVAHGGSGCGGIIDDFNSRFEHAGGSVIPWLNFLPALFGVLFVAPFVLEFEHGTFRLAWTQSITRKRWLTVKLAFILFCGLAAAFALTALMTWWRHPLDQLHGRMEPNVFDFEGVVPYAYTFFAIALAVALGVFTRRVVVSIAGTLLGYFVLRIGIQSWVRQHYLPPLKAVWRLGQPGPAHLDIAWNLFSGPADARGHRLANTRGVISTCFNGSSSKQQVESCLHAHHVQAFNVAVYQPASRFWIFQGIESGIFAGLAVLLLIAAVWWVKRRIA